VTRSSTVTYTIGVVNNGPDPATSVTVVDTLPATTTFASCTATNGGRCGGTGNTRLITFPALESGASATITLTATVNADVKNGEVIDNIARVSAVPVDPVLGNNSARATVMVPAPTADLALTIADTPDPITTGQNLTYTLIVTNNGPDPATNLRVTDSLPPNVAYVNTRQTTQPRLSRPIRSSLPISAWVLPPHRTR
jgi:uncharacterized repeat protein (TIGR01451 family)